MPTENKKIVYLLGVRFVFTALENITGQAPIADINNYITRVEDPNASPKAWLMEGVGRRQEEMYNIQTYRVTGGEIATFINNRHGTSYSDVDILDFRKSFDSSFYEIETV